MENLDVNIKWHKNVKTNKDYQCGNQERLIEEANEKGYTSNYWGTYLQWNKLGYKIIKGEKGCVIFHPARVKTGKLDREGEPKYKEVRKYFRVFNEEQVVEKEQVVNDENIILLAA